MQVNGKEKRRKGADGEGETVILALLPTGFSEDLIYAMIQFFMEAVRSK